MKFQGIIPPIATPFRDDEEIDEEALRRLARYYVDVGVHGLCVCGNSGEGASLTLQETLQCCRAVLTEAQGKVPVIAGIFTDCTRDAVRLGIACKEVGVDALMVAPVHQNPTNDDGLYEFYAAVGQRVDLPIMIYDCVPSVRISPSLVARLAEIPQVRAIKVEEFRKLIDLLLLVRNRMSMISTMDDALYPSFILGAEGAMGGIPAIAPELAIQLWEATKAGRHQEALALHNRTVPLWRVFEADWLPRSKVALTLRGLPAGRPRSPRQQVGSDVQERIRAALAEAGVPKVLTS